MKLHFVETMDQVLALALEQPLPQEAIPAEAQPLPMDRPSEGPTAHQ
jgi:hypothetical protein